MNTQALLDTDVVSYTTYDGGQAVASSLRMAVRAVREKGMAGKVILVPKTMNPEIYSQVVQYCRNVAEVRKIAYEPETGLMDLEELKEQLAKKNVAAVFFENPTYLGNFETRGEEIAKLAHDAGAYCVVQTIRVLILYVEIYSLLECTFSSAVVRQDLLHVIRIWIW